MTKVAIWIVPIWVGVALPWVVTVSIRVLTNGSSMSVFSSSLISPSFSEAATVCWFWFWPCWPWFWSVWLF